MVKICSSFSLQLEKCQNWSFPYTHYNAAAKDAKKIYAECFFLVSVKNLLHIFTLFLNYFPLQLERIY